MAIANKNGDKIERRLSELGFVRFEDGRIFFVFGGGLMRGQRPSSRRVVQRKVCVGDFFNENLGLESTSGRSDFEAGV